MENKVPVRFFVFTFIWSWLIWGIAIFLGFGNKNEFFMSAGVGVEFILTLIGAFGPAVGAILSVLTIEGKGALPKFFRQFFSLRFGWKTWVLIFLILGAAGAIAWILPEFFGAERINTYLPSVLIFPVYYLVMVFFGGGQEEIGWRGYISPFLEKKFGLAAGGLILGIIWAIWHLPLWFISGTSQVYMNFAGFMMGLIGKSYIFSWIVKKSGNRLSSGLAIHGAVNAFAALFPFLILADNARQTRFWLYQTLILITGIIIVIIRIKNEKKT